jgi:hypothetical protein
VARRSVVSALTPPLKAEEIRELVSRNNYRRKIQGAQLLRVFFRNKRLPSLAGLATIVAPGIRCFARGISWRAYL